MKKLILALTFLFITHATQASELLVSTDWLAKNISDKNLVLLDMSDSIQYQRFHIPGAINLPYPFINMNDKGVSLSVGQKNIIDILGKIGVNASSYVVIYDDTGGLNAGRLFWELEQLGHKKVSILDGGLVKWIRENRKVSGEAPKLKSTTYKAARTETRATATLDTINAAVKNKNALLLDVRTEDEYRGNPKFPRSGHIPGARWWEWDQGVNFDGGFVMQDNNKLLESLRKTGLHDKKQDVIVYCRSGHRASSAYLTLRALGFENVRLYDGSMKEYTKHKDLPLKLGMEP